MYPSRGLVVSSLCFSSSSYNTNIFKLRLLELQKNIFLFEYVDVVGNFEVFAKMRKGRIPVVV